MSEYVATVHWQRSPNELYIDNQYSRSHQWLFDGGSIIEASSSPHIVAIPQSIEANVDPEEAFIASLASCHMLFFLSIAAKNKFVVDNYEDNASGLLQQNNRGKYAMTKVTLSPKVIFSGDAQPSLKEFEKMHYQAHQQCFIANSVHTDIVIDICYTAK
jgi:organic hydroperoxide reductase OsmC/OhrA